MKSSTEYPAGRPVLLACMPKSGSSFISEAICVSMKYARATLRLDSYVQEFHPRKLQRAKRYGVVSQSHMLASDYCVNQVNRYGVRVIVLEREMLDALVSLRDYIAERGWTQVIAPIAFLGPEYAKRSGSEQLDYLIETSLPWYVRFHLSWKWRAPNLRHAPLPETYEAFFSDPVTRLIRIVNHLGTEMSEDEAAAALAQVGPSRFNVGRPGRAKDVLSKKQLARANEIFALYGLPPYTDGGRDYAALDEPIESTT